MSREEEIEARLKAANNGRPWLVKDYADKSQVGRDWEIAHFGECARHNKKVWVTTNNLLASQSNGACPCADADLFSNAPSDLASCHARIQESRMVIDNAKHLLADIAHNGMAEYGPAYPSVINVKAMIAELEWKK